MEIGNNPGGRSQDFRFISPHRQARRRLMYTLLIVDDEPNILEESNGFWTGKAWEWAG